MNDALMYFLNFSSSGCVPPHNDETKPTKAGKAINLPYLIYTDYRNTQSQSLLSSDILKPSFPQSRPPGTTMHSHSSQERQQLPETAAALLSLKQRNPITSFHFSVPPPFLLSHPPSPRPSFFISLTLFFFFFLFLPCITVALSISCLVKLPRHEATRGNAMPQIFDILNRGHSASALAR